jgi:hypothetical protein
MEPERLDKRYAPQKNGETVMNCPHCENPIEPQTAWRSAPNRFFCSEFCADAEASEIRYAPSPLLQYHLDNGYLDRLQRLVAMRRANETTQPA